MVGPIEVAFCDQVRALGQGIVCVHKGLSGNNPYASPADIGPAAARHPDITFVVYHSGWELAAPEGPFRLIWRLYDAGPAVAGILDRDAIRRHRRRSGLRRSSRG